MSEDHSDTRLARIWNRARSTADILDPDRAFGLAQSPVPDERLLAVMRMRVAIERGVPATNYVAVACQFINDQDNDCRWQGLIVVGESISANPEAVWHVIEEHGAADDPDLRTGVATVLLEHLLEAHFDRFYPQVLRRVLSGDNRFAETVSTSWVSTPDSPYRRRLEHLLEAAKRGVREVK